VQTIVDELQLQLLFWQQELKSEKIIWCHSRFPFQLDVPNDVIEEQELPDEFIYKTGTSLTSR
jgi:hypothetical protein